MSSRCPKCKDRRTLIPPKVDERVLCDREGDVIHHSEHWLRSFECHHCHCTWLGCECCDWASDVKGIDLRARVNSVVAFHSRQDSHKANLRSLLLGEPTSDSNAKSNVESMDDMNVAQFDDETPVPMDTLDESSPSQLLEVPELSTSGIEMAFVDSDQTEASIQESFANIKSKRMKQYIFDEQTENCLGLRRIVYRSLNPGDRRTKINKATPLPTFEGAQLWNAMHDTWEESSVDGRERLDWIWKTLVNMPPDNEMATLGFKVPRTFQEMNRALVTGRNSMRNSQPTPHIHVVGSHVVAEIIDVIKFHCLMADAESFKDVPVISMSLGAPEEGKTVASYFESKAFCLEMKRILEEMAESGDMSDRLMLAFKLWSDGCDPDKCKDNRNAIWLAVLSLLFGEGPEVVFPVALGPKSDDHKPALRKILQLIHEFHDHDGYATVYLGAVKRVARVKLNLSLYNVDRIEREELWGAFINGTNRCKCFGVVEPFAASTVTGEMEYKRYPACSGSFKRLIYLMVHEKPSEWQRSMLQDKGCSNDCSGCACYDPTPTNGSLNAPLPKNYPTEAVAYDGDIEVWKSDHVDDVHLVGDPSKPPPERPVGQDVMSLGPVSASQQFMLIAAQFITYQCWRGNVNKVSVFESFAMACGIGKGTYRPLFDKAKESRDKDFAEVFTKNLLPPTWVDPSLPLWKFLNAMMHLLFLGTSQSVTERVEEYLALCDLKSSFVKFASKCLDQAGKLGQQWLHAKKYGILSLTRGSWVSEEYVAFLRYFLVAHAGLIGLNSCDRRNAPPQSEVKAVLRVVESAYCFISRIMQRDMCESLITEIAGYIKVYLGAIDRLGLIIFQRKKAKAAKAKAAKAAKVKEKSNAIPEQQQVEDAVVDNSKGELGKKRKNEETGKRKKKRRKKKKELDDEYLPLSLKVPNNASLPTVPDMLRMFGSPLYSWDGGDGCEKSIQSTTPYVHGASIHDPGHLRAALTRLYAHRYQRLTHDKMAQTSTLSKPEKKKRIRHTAAKLYKSRNDLESAIQKRHPLSATLFQRRDGNNVMAILLKASRHNKVYLPVQLNCAYGNSSLSSFANGMVYFGRLSVAHEASPALTDESTIIARVTIVPGTHIYRDEKYTECTTLAFDHLWTAFTDDYKVLQEDGSFQFKQLTPWLWDDVE